MKKEINEKMNEAIINDDFNVIIDRFFLTKILIMKFHRTFVPI